MQENKFWSAPWCPPNNILPLLRVLNLKPRGKDGERHSALRAYGHTHPADPVIAAASAIRRRLDARQPLTTADRHLLTCWAQAAAGLTGEVDILGWRFDFSDVLRPYAYKLRGEWHSAMATDKTTLRNIIGERPYDIAAPGDTRYAWPRLLLEDGMLQAYAKRPADKTFRPYNTALRARMSRHAPDTLLSTMLPDTPETRALLRRLSASPDTGAMRMQLRRRAKVIFDTGRQTD